MKKEKLDGNAEQVVIMHTKASGEKERHDDDGNSEQKGPEIIDG